MLMIHRRKRGDEYWVLVGGGVEEGETEEEALAREVMEETSFQLKNYIRDTEAEENGTHHVLYFCESEQEEPVLGGPEKEANNPDNWYNPEWVEISTVAAFTDVYPMLVTKWAEKWLKDNI